jgi:hypothetical protein
MVTGVNSTVDSRVIVRKIAGDLIAHRNALAGKAEDAYRAQEALEATARAVGEHHADHRNTAATATSHWEGRNAQGFDRKARRMTRALRTTATVSGGGAKIVADTAAALDGGHRAVTNLVEEYTTRAAGVLDAGRAATGAGSRAALMRAVGQVVDLVRTYTNESTAHVRSVRGEMKAAAAKLRKLERTVEHDGFADPGRARRPRPAPEGRGGGGKILNVARSQLGYREGPNNANKYGPDVAWCASFATWVWRKSGVDIGILPFTGDVYSWGQERGLAYGKNNLDSARPGDVLLFGTGPQSPSTSTHIGIVESVKGDKVTLIEGNSSDRVQRVTHTLSSATFYGGVHPR